MAIQTNNLVLYKSERLTDTSDGGGKYSGQIVIDGESNNLFPDVSELDRTMGRVSMRKIFAGVNSADTDALMGSTVFISENPIDPNVSALLFSTRSHTDMREAAKNRVENYLAKGAQIAGTPLDTLWQGMKLIQVAMFPVEEPSSVGDTIVLCANEGKPNEYEQYLRITAVETRIAIMIVDGKQAEYKIASYTVNDALSHDFTGLSAAQWYSGAKSQTIVRDTIVADTGKYYTSVKLADDATLGSFTIQAASMFAQLLPSPQVETPLLDLNSVSENTALVAANDGTITVQVTTNVNNSQSLYIGSSVMPGTVSFTLFGQAITDNGGTLRNAGGTQVATIDYQTGHIVWTNAIGSGSATINITFVPAAAPTQPFESYALPVTAANQGTNWTGVLMPIPAPGALIVSFMSQGKFYVLKDNGTGRLVAANDSIGSGSINYQTGTWLLTTGALPDVGTPILLQWGSPIETFPRANLPVLPAGLDFQLFHKGIVSATVTWLLDGEEKTATSNSKGEFTGNATGYIRFNSGKGRIIPKKLPHKNTVFTINYDYGTGKDQSVNGGDAVAGVINFTIGTGVAIKPSSVGLSIPVSSDGDVHSAANVELRDDGEGNLITNTGEKQGTIDYATGACSVKPSIKKTVKVTRYEPMTFYSGG